MNKIDILIKDNKEFGDVAFLVDKPTFLKAVERLRKKWGLDKLIALNKFKEWTNGLFYKRETKQKEQEILRSQPTDHLSDVDLEVFKEQIERVMPDVDFECDVRDLRIQFNRPETFDKAIAYAIVCGIIPDGVYKSTYWAHDFSTPAPIRLQDRTSRVAIYVTPQSQKQDVLEAFKEVREGVLKSRSDGYDPFFSLYDKDEVTNIKRDRDWYWLYLEEQKSGRGIYERITDRWNKMCPDPGLDPHDNCHYCVNDINIFQQAVRRYKKSLNY